MMHNITVFIFMISLVFIFSSCISDSDMVGQADNAPSKSKDPAISLASAAGLEKTQQYMEALKQYNQLIDTAENRFELYAAMRGKARCLRALGRLKLAVSALSPLAVNPKNPLDCRQLAMAGELFLQMHKYEEAESTLEVALDGVRDKEKKYSYWTAAASANLGNAYLRNGKLQQSRIMYKKAAELFNYLNKPELEKKCFRTILALNQIQVKD